VKMRATLLRATTPRPPVLDHERSFGAPGDPARRGVRPALEDVDLVMVKAYRVAAVGDGAGGRDGPVLDRPLGGTATRHGPDEATVPRSPGERERER
jgi:hypothetical protein